SSTCAPPRAASIAAYMPAAPEPMTSTSVSMAMESAVMALHYGVMAWLVAGPVFHLSPEGRGRGSEASEGEGERGKGGGGGGFRKLKFFSYVRTPSPQPSPLWGEGVRVRKPGSCDRWKAHGAGVVCGANAAARRAANCRSLSFALERSTGWPRLPSLPVSAASTSEGILGLWPAFVRVVTGVA